MAQPGPLFSFSFRYFQTQILQENEGSSRIQTRIVGRESEHTDHLTTTTAQSLFGIL